MTYKTNRITQFHNELILKTKTKGTAIILPKKIPNSKKFIRVAHETIEPRFIEEK